jgi:Zn-dependent M28 family amino/carboxypeptidase
MAPRSGWWQCVSEQGSRLACWLEAIRILAAGKPARDFFFVALSGHELGLLGIEAYQKRRGDLVKRAHAWIFFGSDIGGP